MMVSAAYLNVFWRGVGRKHDVFDNFFSVDRRVKPQGDLCGWDQETLRSTEFFLE